MLVVLLLAFVTTALAGTVCPPRENIYPCSCVAVPQGKKTLHTTVYCHRIESTDSLAHIFNALRVMTIDRFHLYDSFWEASKLETTLDKIENKQVLPTDWFTLLNIKEMEIVDTPLSQYFACHSKEFCKNIVTTRFTAVNSSSHEEISTECNDNKGKNHSWTACLANLKEFHFRQGGLTILRSNFFPKKMLRLEELDFSYNRIAKIETKAFKNVMNLKVLLLSHNSLESVNGMFSDTMNKLERLDLSWNSLKMLSDSLFSHIPNIKTLMANNNQIVHLREEQWKDYPESLRVINIEENPIDCECDIKWVKSTFHNKTTIKGRCATPKRYKNTFITKATMYLNKFCDENGNIGTKPRSQTAVTKKMNES